MEHSRTGEAIAVLTAAVLGAGIALTAERILAPRHAPSERTLVAAQTSTLHAPIEPAPAPPVAHPAPVIATGSGDAGSVETFRAPSVTEAGGAQDASGAPALVARANAEASAAPEAGAARPERTEQQEAGAQEQREDASAPQRVQLVRCGPGHCPAGYECCNDSCGICTPPGQTCADQVCNASPWPTSESCGPNTCNVGQVCCNPSCGICAAPGAECDTTPCSDSIQYPFSVPCGMNTCNVGQICCNPSCGICTAPGETCSHETCR